MKILLTGRDGQVGWELEGMLQPLGEVVATDRSALDLSRLQALSERIKEVKPGIIVNAAAYTAVDKAESEPELAMQVNGAAPGIIAEEAKRLGALLVHYSTDYVFDGEKRSPYVEEDAPHPLGAYGRSKLEGERRIAAAGCRALVLRASWVYSPSRGRNFFRTIAGKARAGERLRVVDDQVGVPTPSDFLASLSVDLIRNGTTGVYHAVPSGETSWHGFAKLIAEKVGAHAHVEPITSKEFPTAAARPRYSVLSNARLAALLGAPLPDWRQVVPPIMKAP